MNMLRGMFCVVALLAPALAQAAAGQVLFAVGRVEIQRDGKAIAATRGAPVEVGDVVSTGPTGLTQLRLADGALLSLRYGSSMKVEEFRLPQPAAAVPTPGATGATGTGGRAALRLLRGAFRTVTGLIGKTGGDSYSVVTPVATIGIRGTDYSAAYCSGDCAGTPDGLYLGVSNGGIDVANAAGQLALGNDQYGYVRDNATAPQRELAPPPVLDAAVPPPEGDGSGDDAATEGTPEGSFGDTAEGTFETGRTQPEGTYEPRAADGGYAYAGPNSKDAVAGTVYVDGHADLIGFTGQVSANIGTAANFDTGGDAAAGVRWGRWHGGVANTTTVDGPGSIDLNTASLHWIYGEGTPALRLTGSQSYTLVGGTNPTDNNGNVGTLGSATLFADFTNNFVSSTVDLTISGPTGGTSTWSASGSGSISETTFGGAYSVSVNGQTGAGGFAGFFTDGGAGVVFELNDGISTTVTGAVGFVETTGSPSPAGLGSGG
jgi:hypothetical protein